MRQESLHGNPAIKNVATINSKGKVVAKRTGKTRISVSSGRWKASCNIKVVNKKYKNPSIRQLASRADSCVLNAFEKLKFNLVIDLMYHMRDIFQLRIRALLYRKQMILFIMNLDTFLDGYRMKQILAQNGQISIMQKNPNSRDIIKRMQHKVNQNFLLNVTDSTVLNKANLRNTCPKTYAYIQKAITNLNNMPSSRLTRMHDTYYKAGIWKR